MNTPNRVARQEIEQYQILIDRIIQGLKDLHDCSCRPLVQIMADGTYVNTGIEKWISDDAEASFAVMQENLRFLLTKQHKLLVTYELEREHTNE